MLLPLLLLLLVGGHSSAFVPAHIIISTPGGNCIQHHDENEHDDVFYTTTKLCAQKKKNVPQMPTLPVTSSSSSSSTRSDFYSTSKTISTPMVVMDVENIRGATSFRISHEALLSRIRLWREDRLSMAPSSTSTSNDNEEVDVDGDDWNLLEPLIWVCDHGMSPSIHHYSLFPNDEDESNKLPHNFGAIFAGDRTADDVIVDLVNLRCGGLPSYHIESNNNVDYEGGSLDVSDDRDDMTRNTTIVITADARLISRCQQARRQSNSLSDVIFVEPSSILQQLERYRINSHEEESLFGEALLQSPTHQITTLSAKNIDVDSGGKRSDGKTSTMTSFKDSSIAAQQHAKFQARFQNSPPESSTISQQPQEESDNSAAIAAQLKTEQIRRQMLLSDAYYLARPSKSRGRKSQSTMAAIHANYKNRNISKKQQKKMYVKRFGKKRKEDLANAAMKRKQLAAKLQLNLERASKGRLEDDDGNVDRVPIIDHSRSVRGGAELLETLLGWFEERRIMIGKKEIHQSSFKKPEQDDPTTLLGLTSGQVSVDDKFDPLGSVINVPLREEQAQSSNKSVAPLRMVVISDTHGFEGALSKFSDDNGHCDDFLPKADLLLHCGDFAASGSRKTQRAAARRLDEFLARQTHIPEKIIVQGNHDPDSPAKVLFPSSKAIYVRSSSTITVNGVHFALEPFSRRMAYRSIRRNVASTSPSDFPKCDILVSHEPPKHILDLTYHGFSAGSFHLKDLVERAENKPRIWLCGHIHESRGILSHRFQPDCANNEDECEATIVINASNANSGRANRIVSGAVVVEVERLSSNSGDHQSAESTLQSRRKVDDYEYLGNGEDSGLAMAGMDGMEQNEYASRPGVRRRKGIPLSVRQQMKQVRSTLGQSQNQGS